jgi:FtsH-binding integral membrane protein
MLAFTYLVNRRKFRQIIAVVAVAYGAIVLASFVNLREDTETLITIGSALGALVVAYLITWGGSLVILWRGRRKRAKN